MTDGNLPAFTNLGAVADELASRGKEMLRAKMTQAWRAQSCLADLRQSSDCVKALRGLINRPRSQDTPEALITERALMTTAIMLYARATSTSTSGTERGSIQLGRDKLTDDEWLDHCAVLEVRNQAMAHVHVGRQLGDHDWHRRLFFAAQLGGAKWAPASATNQTSFHAATLDRLERILPVALREVKAKFNKRMNAVTKMINDEVKAETLAKHLFDPLRVFGSVEAVQAVLAGAAAGESALWVNEGHATD